MSEQPPRVCAIEDNPADIRLVEEGIDSADIALDLAVRNNGRQAIEWLTGLDGETSTHPELVLLDLNLPGKSGFEVLDIIRTETPFQDVPVVIVSSSQDRNDVGRAYELAANAYVTKPKDPDEYIRMVESAVNFWIATND